MGTQMKVKVSAVSSFTALFISTFWGKRVEWNNIDQKIKLMKLKTKKNLEETQNNEYDKFSSLSCNFFFKIKTSLISVTRR